MIESVWHYLVGVVTKPIGQLTLLDLGALLLGYGVVAISLSLLVAAIKKQG